MRTQLLLALALSAAVAACRTSDTHAVSAAAPATPGSSNPAVERFVGAPLAAAWRATVEAVHATGIAVPADAELEATRGRIETHELRVLVEADSGTTTRVRVQYLEPFPDEAERRARLLLDDVELRLQR